MKIFILLIVSLVHCQETKYSYNAFVVPQTATTVDTEVKPNPGDFFRSGVIGNQTGTAVTIETEEQKQQREAAEKATEVTLLKKQKEKEETLTANDLIDVMKCPKMQGKKPMINAETTAFTGAVYENIYGKIKAVHNGLSKTCVGNDCQKSDFSGCIVRLAAHDFLDTTRSIIDKDGKKAGHDKSKNNAGGSDGCISMNLPLNKGLKDCLKDASIKDYLTVYEEFCDTVSLPDFIVLSAEALMSIQSTCERSTKNSFKYNFRYGRKWCGLTAAPKNTAMGHVLSIPSMLVGADKALMQNALDTKNPNLHNTPNTNLNIETRPVEVLERMFISNLFYNTTNVYKQPSTKYSAEVKTCNKTLNEMGGLTQDVILGTALMGAHTIGKASKNASGYDGFWTDPESSMKFNNGFFEDLLYKGYLPNVQTAAPKAKCPALSTDDTCGKIGGVATRCPMGKPFCDIAASSGDVAASSEKGSCSKDVAIFAKDTISVYHYDNRECNTSKSSWSRESVSTFTDHKELMLNVDLVLAHNHEQLSATATCCAFYEAAFLEAKGFTPKQLEKACKTKETCCGASATEQCSKVASKRTFDFSKHTAKAAQPAMTETPLDTTESLTFDSYLYNGKSEHGIALDAVMAFAKDETTWLHYFHKAWYLATTNGHVGLKRIDYATNGQTVTAGVECFSWGCESYTSGSHYNEGFTLEFNTMETMTSCNNSFKELTCSDNGPQNVPTSELGSGLNFFSTTYKNTIICILYLI